MIYKIGKQEFKSKKACTEYVRDLLNQLGECLIEPGHEHWEFMSALVMTPEQNRVKFPDGIKAIKISVNRLNHRGYHMDAQRLDGIWIDVNWRECSGMCVNRRKIVEAMRTSISDQILTWRQAQQCACQVCKCNIGLEVDHYPLTFDTIMKNYLKVNMEPLPTEFPDDQYYRCNLGGGKFKTDWLEYHQKFATFRLLCQNCHRQCQGKHAPKGKCLL